MDNEMIEDVASLNEWFEDNEECFIMPYIETHFKEASWNYQLNVMRENLYFSKKIIDDDLMSNDEKQMKLLKQLAYGKSKIVVIEGGRGGGKTVTASWIMDELHNQEMHNRVYYVKAGERPRGLPSWIHNAQDVDDVPNGSLAIVDESAIKYNSRKSWSDENKDFVARLVILRHKDISVILITQHLKMIDIGIRRLADIKIYKKGANLTHEDESMNDQRRLVRERFKPHNVDECLVEITLDNQFFKFKHEMPEWFDDMLSKAFSDFNPEAESKKGRVEKMRYAKEMKAQEFEEKRKLEFDKLDKMKELGLIQIAPHTNRITKKQTPQKELNNGDNFI